MKWLAILAILLVAPSLGGCALLAAGFAGAVIEHEINHPYNGSDYSQRLPRGFRWCYQAGGGPPVRCKAWPGKAGHGWARRGKARQGKEL